MDNVSDEFLIALTRATLARLEGAWPTLTNKQKGVANLDCRLYIEQAAQWPYEVDWETTCFVAGVVRLIRGTKKHGGHVTVERAVERCRQDAARYKAWRLRAV